MTGSAAYIRTLHGWRTVCALVTMTSLHPDAFATALDALAVVARPPALATPSFPPCLEAVMAVAERNASKARPALPLQAPEIPPPTDCKLCGYTCPADISAVVTRQRAVNSDSSLWD